MHKESSENIYADIYPHKNIQKLSKHYTVGKKVIEWIRGKLKADHVFWIFTFPFNSLKILQAGGGRLERKLKLHWKCK